MIVPERRSRIWGMTACVIASVPNTLVSKTSRIIAMGVASKAPTTPMPALLTKTSIAPAAAIPSAMLSGSVTSSARTRMRLESGNSPATGRRMVAITVHPREWK